MADNDDDHLRKWSCRFDKIPCKNSVEIKIINVVHPDVIQWYRESSLRYRQECA